MMHVMSSRPPVTLPNIPERARPTSPPSPRTKPGVMEPATHKWVEVPTQALDANSRLLAEGMYSDVALAYGGDLFRAHRAVICPRSRIFKAECDGRFSEAENRRIDIGAPSATLGAIARMLVFLYSHDYSNKAIVTRSTTNGEPTVIIKQAQEDADECSLTNTGIQYQAMALEKPPDATNPPQEYFDPSSIPLRDLHVYGLADYYYLTDLKDVAKRKFSEALEQVTDGQELKEIIAQVYEYTHSDDALRSIVTDHSAAMRHRLNNDPGFLSGVSIIPDFMKDYLIATTLSYENEIVEQTEKMMKERERITQQLNSEKIKSANFKLQVNNNQTVIGSLNKRITGLTRICNAFNEKYVCPSCQTSQPLQVVKPRLKRPSSPRTDEDSWSVVCSTCSRRVSKSSSSELPRPGEVTRSISTGSPS